MKSRMEPDTLKYMASICRERISKGGESNYHIFINSVKGIARIITRAGLKQEDVRIVCSTSGDSHARNLAILPVGFKIEKTTDPVKTINFYTSTCFEGQDIYDEIGRTFVVSDKYTNHTKLDISTTLLQICGRIRDSRFKNEITQIFSTSRYTNVSFDEFVKSIRKKYLEAKQDAACLNGLTADRKHKMISRILRSGEPYLDVRDDQIIVDENVAKLEIINFKIVNGQYATKTNMVIALTNTGLLVEDAEEAPEDIEGSKTVVSRTTFKDAFLQYCKLRKAQPKFCFGKNLEMEQIEAAKPMVKQAYEELGEEEVKKMDYHVSNIKRALVAKMNMTTEYKIVRIINDSIPRLVAVPVNEVKKKLQETYDSLNLIRNAKATDLAEWYDVDMVQRKMEDKNVRCVIIKSAKVKFGI